MKITIENTDQLVSLQVADGGPYVPARIWEGTSENGVPVICFITRILVRKDEDQTQFQRELREVRNASPEALAIDLRFIL